MSDLFRNKIISSSKMIPPKCPMKSKNPEMYAPIPWNVYFDYKEDLATDEGTFRIYRRGFEGPLLFFLHGGGFSALSWALLSKFITEEVKCQCLAMDMRGHGDTFTSDDTNLSADVMAKDVGRIIMTMFPSEAPPIILIGHSMGGAIAIHAAVKSVVPSLVGLVVIDVVEGSALEALYSMNTYLQSRPKVFKSIQHAIEWSVKTGQLRNSESARVSFPGQLKNIGTNLPGTRYIDSMDPETAATAGVDEKSSGNNNPHLAVDSATKMNAICEDEEAEDNDAKAEGMGEPSDEGTPSGSVCNSRSAAQKAPVEASAKKEASVHTSQPVSSPETGASFTWRIDLTQTEMYWRGWFQGMSQMFLSINQPKLLLLAGIDRMDKDLTIGQMQGKFQTHIIPQSGHAVHEDAPDKVADCLASFLIRNRFTEAKSSFEKNESEFE